MRYILEVNEQVRPEALQALLERESGPEAKDTIVTAGQQLIEQGIEQGRQRFQAVLVHLLRQRFGAEVDPHVRLRLPVGLARPGQDLDVPIRSMHADPLPIPDQPGGMLHPHDGRQAVLPCDHRAMGHQAAHLRHQALDRDEQGASSWGPCRR